MKTSRTQETEFIQAINDRFEVRCGMATLLRWLTACDGDAARAEAALLAAGCIEGEEEGAGTETEGQAPDESAADTEWADRYAERFVYGRTG